MSGFCGDLSSAHFPGATYRSQWETLSHAKLLSAALGGSENGSQEGISWVN
jgi:hypothetical protein